MNRKQITTLLVLVLLIGGLGLILFNRKEAGWSKGQEQAGQKLVQDFPLNDVTRISIHGPDGELNLLVRDDAWRVEERWGYPADFSLISDFLRKIWDLRIVRTQQVGPSQLHRLELLSPDAGVNAGTLVEFFDAGGESIHSLLLGKKYLRDSPEGAQFGGGSFPVGRFVKAMHSPSDVRVIADPLTDIQPNPERWLDKSFFKVEKLRSISVSARDPEDSWRLFRETESGEWRLAEPRPGEALDSSKLWSVRNALSSPSFNDVISPDTTPEDAGLSEPIVARLETFDDFVYTVKVGDKVNGSHHLRVSVEASLPAERPAGEDESEEEKERLDQEFKANLEKLQAKLQKEQAYQNWTYLVANWTVDPLLKNRSEFLAEKNGEPAEPVEPDFDFPSPLEQPDLLPFEGLQIQPPEPPVPPIPPIQLPPEPVQLPAEPVEPPAEPVQPPAEPPVPSLPPAPSLPDSEGVQPETEELEPEAKEDEPQDESEDLEEEIEEDR